MVFASACALSHERPAARDAGAVALADAGRVTATDAGPSLATDAGPRPGIDARVALDAYRSVDARTRPGIDTTGFVPAPCTVAYQADMFGPGQPRAPFLFVGAVDDSFRMLVDGVGTMECAGEQSTGDCYREVFTRNYAGELYVAPRTLVSYTGTVVAREATPAVLDEVIGPVLTPEDAALRAWAAGYDMACTPPRGGMRQVAEGYQIIGTHDSTPCDAILQQVRLVVTWHGQVTELERAELDPDPSCP